MEVKGPIAPILSTLYIFSLAALWKAAYGKKYIYIYVIDFKVASELGTLLLFQYVWHAFICYVIPLLGIPSYD